MHINEASYPPRLYVLRREEKKLRDLCVLYVQQLKIARDGLAPIVTAHADSSGGGGFVPHENPSAHARNRKGTWSG